MSKSHGLVSKALFSARKNTKKNIKTANNLYIFLCFTRFLTQNRLKSKNSFYDFEKRKSQKNLAVSK